MPIRWHPNKLIKHQIRLIFLVFLSLVGKNIKADGFDEITQIKIVWSLSEASMSMAELAKQYTSLSGVEVELVILPTGPSWYHRVLAELSAGGDGFDILVMDYHYLPEFSESGYLTALAPYLTQSKQLAIKDFNSDAVKIFSEYPEASSHYWSLPLQRDALGLVYRLDLFNDPQQQKAFKQRYGYALRPPKDKQQLIDIAQFFTRPDRGLWGWGQTTSDHNNAIVTSAVSFIWSAGGKVLDPSKQQAVGYLDSKSSITGLQDYMRMLDFMPEHQEDWDYVDINRMLLQGELAMALNWVSSINELNASSREKQFSIAPFPSNKTLLMGQAIAINQFSHKKHLAWDFIEWFFQTQQQKAFSMHGQSFSRVMNKPVKEVSISSDNDQLNPILFNSESFLKIPLYASFIEILQQEISAVLHREKSPKQALTIAAKRHQLLLNKDKEH
ncbi:MAG: extracellular solute-binding protein [Enterobacterales bacterium]|nr:extracellular solute-binding protein [Enterobacterales bacterium]